MQPAGVQGTKDGSRPFCANRPRLTGWNPSTSLSTLTVFSTASSSLPGGRGSWTKMPLHALISVQISDELNDLLLRRVCRKLMMEGHDPGFFARLAFGAHITVRGWVIAHQHRCQTGLGHAFGLERRYLAGHIGSNLSRQGRSIDQFRSHVLHLLGWGVAQSGPPRRVKVEPGVRCQNGVVGTT